MTDELPLKPEPTPWASFRASVAGVLTKESRWRMRGRRAFVIVTIYLVVLALLVVAVYQTILDRAVFMARFQGGGPSGDFVSASVSVQVGQGLFAAILILQTVLTVLLAPAMSSGAISSEREKQTLDLLVTTPVSTVGLVTGKLFSSLAYLFLLIVASVPLMSLVFAFGGIAPDDVVRAYILLFAVAIGLGSIGLFMSALLKRSQLATAVSYVIVFVLTIATLVVHSWMYATSSVDARGNFIPPERRSLPPEMLLWLNPFVADVDVLCTAIPDSSGSTCQYPATVMGREVDPANLPRDQFWPRTAIAFVLLGVALTLASTQLIAPSRRIRRDRLPPSFDAPSEDSATVEPLTTEPSAIELEPVQSTTRPGRIEPLR
jgi:ABC-type transport system involved in multi-copper enzyme maturation permease subunit